MDNHEAFQKIGLMADSHGNLPATIAAINCLKKNGAERVYHLGDLFDSALDNDFIGILQEVCNNHVLSVKGNNDYQVEQALAKGTVSNLAGADRLLLITYLQNMPMKREIYDICMTHSLPYDNIRAFYEPIDDGGTSRAEKIFRETDYFLICCGHSHHPVLFRWRYGKVSREALSEKYRVHFFPAERYILIVGSVDSGECGLLDFRGNVYQRLRIFQD